MSESTLLPSQRAFHCSHCNGRIVIPADLAPTTGPCPHCQGTITSPAPEPVTPSAASQSPKPVERNFSASATAPSPTRAPEPTIILATVEKSDPKPAAETKFETSKKSDKSTKRTSPVALILIGFFLLIALGGGAYFVMGMMKKKDELTAPTPINIPTKQVINPTLQKYIAATTLDEKLNFVFNSEELRPKIEAFYKQQAINETDTKASAFSIVKLPESDSKKGFILLTYNQPTPDATAPPVKILAFLKETEAGVKLDWEVFAQTKYRTFSKFTKTPTPGKSEVFRVVIAKAATDTNPFSNFSISDPIHSSDKIKIALNPNSPGGKTLSQLTGTTQRTATIELAWSADPKNPKLEIKRFICWEFLGLGGKEIAETNPSN